MAFKLPAVVSSPVLVDGVRTELAAYLEWDRDRRVKERVGQPPATEPTFSAETTATIQTWFGDKPATVEGLSGLVTELKALKLPVVHLTLAALPNHAQRQALVDWFRTNASGDTLLSFSADRTLGGGAVVRTTNHVYDLSWRQRLVEGRTKLGEIVKRV